jgi:hypothetical protein
MARFERITLTPVTDSSSDAVVYTPQINGRIVSVRYIKAASNGYTDGVDFDLEGETSGLVVWSEDDVNASKTIYPLAEAATTAGVALEYADGFAQCVPIATSGERLKLTVGAGGALTTGTFEIVIEGVCLS